MILGQSVSLWYKARYVHTQNETQLRRSLEIDPGTVRGWGKSDNGGRRLVETCMYNDFELDAYSTESR